MRQASDRNEADSDATLTASEAMSEISLSGKDQKLLFGRYQIERELGRGGMGRVLLAWDTHLGIWVAVKLLLNISDTNLRAFEGLRNEVLSGIQLTHPGILRTHTFERDGNSAGIVMEYVEGCTLAESKKAQAGGCFDCEQILPWIEQLCDVLDYAHKVGRIVHRDIKPRNVMLALSGQLKVADFGISSCIDDGGAGVNSHSKGGTPPYMSPQQISAEQASPLDDIYSLGAVTYELLTGRPPFYRGTPVSITRQVMEDSPPSMSERRLELGVREKKPIPLAWERAVASCLAKEPSARPQTAGQFFAMLHPPAAHPSSREPAPQRVQPRLPETATRIIPAPQIAVVPEMRTAPAGGTAPDASRPHKTPFRSAMLVFFSLAALFWFGKTVVFEEKNGDGNSAVGLHSSSSPSDHRGSPVPEPLDLAELAASPADWPKSVLLVEPITFFLRNPNGKAVGEVKAAAGNQVALMRVNANEIEIGYCGATRGVSADSTDLCARVAKLRKERDEANKGKRPEKNPQATTIIGKVFDAGSGVVAGIGGGMRSLENQAADTLKPRNETATGEAGAEFITELASGHLREKLGKNELSKFAREPMKVLDAISDGIEMTCKALDKDDSYAPAWMLKGRYHLACMELDSARRAFEKARQSTERRQKEGKPALARAEDPGQMLEIVAKLQKPGSDRIALASTLLSRTGVPDNKTISAILSWVNGRSVISRELAFGGTMNSRNKSDAERQLDSDKKNGSGIQKSNSLRL